MCYEKYVWSVPIHTLVDLLKNFLLVRAPYLEIMFLPQYIVVVYSSKILE